jgi:hypothetical protein
MNHQFFDHHLSISQHAAGHSTFVPKTYDLNIQPNAVAQGLPVEADEEGRVVAVRYPDGHRVRNNFAYMVHQGENELSFVDRNQLVHPLD